MQALLEGLSFLGISAVLTGLILTGRYMQLVSPLILPLLIMTALFFFLWGLAALKSLWQPSYRRIFRYCLVLTIPAILWSGPLLYGMAYSPASQAMSQQKDQMPAEKHPFGIDFDDTSHLGIDKEHKRIILSTKNYYTDTLTLMKNLSAYEGYDIYAVGFVSYHEKERQGKEFTLARYLMFCCINDLSPFGLYCYYDGPQNWDEYQWVAVKGVITKRAYHGLMQPAIEVKAIVPAQKVEGYIYPY